MPRTAAKHRGQRVLITEHDLDHPTPTATAGEDGEAASSPLLPDDLAIVRRRDNGQFMDGPTAAVRSKAAIRRSAGMRQRRYLVTRELLSCVSRESIEAHYLRLDLIIRRGPAKDAVAAFKTLYGLIAVPPGEDTRVLAEAAAKGLGGDAGQQPTVIILPDPPEREATRGERAT